MSYMSIRLVPETLRNLAAASIGAAYMGVGSAFENPVRILNIQNLTDANVIFSFDGINDHVILPSNGFILLDITANKEDQRGTLYIAQGTRIYAKEEDVTPTSGSVYVTAFYGHHT